jgi:hypothetical protein
LIAFQAVSISSVRTALEKLEINIPVDDVLTAIRDAEAKRIALSYPNVSHPLPLLSVPLQSNLPTVVVALPLPPPQPTDLQIITSRNSPKPQAEIFDLERRCRLSRLTKEGSHLFRLGFHRPRITFPLILVDRIVITNAEDMSANPPRTLLTDL